MMQCQLTRHALTSTKSISVSPAVQCAHLQLLIVLQECKSQRSWLCLTVALTIRTIPPGK